MQRKLIAAFAALTATFSFTAVADTSSEDALDYRKAVMTALRGHIGASSMIARGLIEDDGHLLGHFNVPAVPAGNRNCACVNGVRS